MTGLGENRTGVEGVLLRERETGARSRNRWDAVLACLEVTKPKSVALLAFTTLAGMVLASASLAVTLTPASLAIGLVAIISGCAGYNAMNC